MEDQVARWRPETNPQSHKNLKALEFSSEGMNFNLGNDLKKARGVSSEMLGVFLKSN